MRRPRSRAQCRACRPVSADRIAQSITGNRPCAVCACGNALQSRHGQTAELLRHWAILLGARLADDAVDELRAQPVVAKHRASRQHPAIQQPLTHHGPFARPAIAFLAHALLQHLRGFRYRAESCSSRSAPKSGSMPQRHPLHRWPARIHNTCSCGQL